MGWLMSFLSVENFLDKTKASEGKNLLYICTAMSVQADDTFNMIKHCFISPVLQRLAKHPAYS